MNSPRKAILDPLFIPIINTCGAALKGSITAYVQLLQRIRTACSRLVAKFNQRGSVAKRGC